MASLAEETAEKAVSSPATEPVAAEAVEAGSDDDDDDDDAAAVPGEAKKKKKVRSRSDRARVLQARWR